MSNPNTPPKPSQPVAPENTIPPGSDSNSLINRPSLTVCQESYEPKSGLMVCLDSAEEAKNTTKVK